MKKVRVRRFGSQKSYKKVRVRGSVPRKIIGKVRTRFSKKKEMKESGFGSLKKWKSKYRKETGQIILSWHRLASCV